MPVVDQKINPVLQAIRGGLKALNVPERFDWIGELLKEKSISTVPELEYRRHELHNGDELAALREEATNQIQEKSEPENKQELVA